MPPRIPPPEYVHESVDGAVYGLPVGDVLVIGQPPAPLANAAPITAGLLVVRYGIPFNTPSTDVLVPGLFVSERGYPMVGREAWDFMAEKFQLYPRAEIVGFRLDGANAQVFLRELDWGAPVRVLIYGSTEQRTPTAAPKAMYVGEGAAPLPELLARYRPPALNLATLLDTPQDR